MKKRFSIHLSSGNLLFLLFLLTCWSNLQAQDIAVISPSIKKSTAVAPFPVKGKVSDASGAMAGVTISEKDKTNVTTSNTDGYFELNVTGPNAVLIVSFVGYKTAELPVNNQHEVAVTMQPGS